MKLYKKGKRGEIYMDYIKKKKVLIKKKRVGSKAIGKIRDEARWLKVLNKRNIGPKLIKTGENCFVMEFVEGEEFLDWYYKSKDRSEIIKNVLKQCRVLDKLKINKYEMHKPLKHILINKNKATMIDFERCKKVLKPKNVTQFCQFLVNIGYLDKDIKNLLIRYKRNDSEKNFKDILNLI